MTFEKLVQLRKQVSSNLFAHVLVYGYVRIVLLVGKMSLALLQNEYVLMTLQAGKSLV